MVESLVTPEDMSFSESDRAAVYRAIGILEGPRGITGSIWSSS